MHYSLRVLTACAAAFAIAGTNACNKTDTKTTTDSTTVTPPPPAPPSEEHYGATMDGLSERPVTVNTGATGSADFTLKADGTIAYTITVTGLSSNPTAAHIHGPADMNAAAGPLLPFNGLAQTMTGTIASGVIDAAMVQGVGIDSLKALMRNGMAYVNVHTATNKDGEIRGQIVKR